MISDKLEEYDQRVSQPRHRENLDRLDSILEKVTGVEQWKLGWDAVLKDRGSRGDHRRDWLAPILAAIIGVIVTAFFAIMLDHKLASAVHVAGDIVHAQVTAGSGKTY
jgi:hypothetical protein